MPITLVQSAAAAFPDGPSPMGLRLQCTPGPGGACLYQPVPGAGFGSAVHCRCMLAPRDAAGGQVQLMGLWSAAGEPIAWLAYDTDTRQAAMQTTSSASAWIDLPAALAWHALELGHDPAAAGGPRVELLVNGISRATLALTTADAATSFWLGGLNPDHSLIGTMDLAHWVIADGGVGVHHREPASAYGDDPARWLVVYNRAVADADAWAEHYRAARGVPYANLCGLDLPTAEVLDQVGYDALAAAIHDYLDRNHLADQVVGLLLGFGVPGYLEAPGSYTRLPITALLHHDSPAAPNPAPLFNPLYRDLLGDRPAADALLGFRFTGRIDGPELATAVALTDRASAVMALPLDPAADRVWIDPVPGEPSVSPVYTQPVNAWADSLEPESLRLPIERAPVEAGHDAVSSAAVVWGWRMTAPPTDFFNETSGRTALCLQLRQADPASLSARDPLGSDWLSHAIAVGYAAAAASSGPFSLTTMPKPGPMFAALRAGWTLAEAWLVAQPYVRGGLQLLGDPLMRLPFPRAGFDVFGPAGKLDQLDLDQPLAVLHAGQAALPLSVSDWEPGVIERLLVRRIDATGRHDGGATSIELLRVGDALVVPPPAAAWPSAADWPVARRGGRVVLTLLWPAELVVGEIDLVQAFAQVEGGDPVAIGELTGSALLHRRVLEIEVAPPTQATRYRFVLHRGPGVREMPWSAWVAPAASLSTTPTPMELA